MHYFHSTYCATIKPATSLKVSTDQEIRYLTCEKGVVNQTEAHFDTQILKKKKKNP